MLIAYEGEMESVNRTLVIKAFEQTPSLILDCGNATDVHALFGKINQEQLHDVYVVNLEAIYRFRKGLEESKKWILQYGFNRVIVTTIHVLFSYDNTIENNNVLEQCWELMKLLSCFVPVHVGVAKDSMHLRFATQFADTIIHVQEKKIDYYHKPRYAH